MNIEHVALNVPDATAFADWYGKHLGMRVLRSLDVSPFTHFLADESGRTVIEVYTHTKAAVPDYFAMNPLILHIAFVSADVKGDCDRLVKAGATIATEAAVTPAGDEMMFLRDPWGVALQLVKRAKALQ